MNQVIPERKTGYYLVWFPCGNWEIKKLCIIRLVRGKITFAAKFKSKKLIETVHTSDHSFADGPSEYRIYLPITHKLGSAIALNKYSIEDVLRVLVKNHQLINDLRPVEVITHTHSFKHKINNDVVRVTSFNSDRSSAQDYFMNSNLWEFYGTSKNSEEISRHLVPKEFTYEEMTDWLEAGLFDSHKKLVKKIREE